jgi:hypothetical protein
MADLDLVDLLDEASLPLKNRVDGAGYYTPDTVGVDPRVRPHGNPSKRESNIAFTLT